MLRIDFPENDLRCALKHEGGELDRIAKTILSRMTPGYPLDVGIIARVRRVARELEAAVATYHRQRPRP